MRKTTYYLYLLMAFALAACAGDSDLLPIGEGDADITMPEETSGIYGNAPILEYDGDPITRSTLTFDITTKTLQFSWEEGDLVGVFPEQENNSKSQTTYKINQVITPHRAKFIQNDVSVNVKKGDKYVSYKPAQINYEGNSSTIPVSFANQYQDNQVAMKYYWDTNVEGNGPNNATYRDSEKEASKHLPDYDIQVSSGAAPEDNNLSFDYTRLVSFVRLYIKLTDQITYDSVIILNKDADFIINATMDISKKVSSEAFTPTKTSHYVTLRLGARSEKDGKYSYAGFKVWDDTEKMKQAEPVDINICPMWSNKNSKAYMVVYMTFAPYAMKSLSLPDGCTLYVLGHDEAGNKKYYRATKPLTKLDLLQNKIHQWAPSDNAAPDDPIELVPVQVEEWKADMNFDNEGTGTEDW